MQRLVIYARNRVAVLLCMASLVASPLFADESPRPIPAVEPVAGSAPEADGKAVVTSSTLESLASQIDRLIAAKTPDYDKVASPVADDAEFFRRVNLDLTGSIPPVGRTRDFLADTNPDKRTALIDALLAGPEFARQWARVLDQMLMHRRNGQNVSLAEWRSYLHKACVENRPWDQLVAEILSADGTDPATRPASRFYLDRGGEVNEITRDIGRVFLGVNLECAQCHNHPHVEDWKQSHYYGISAFLVRSSLFKEGDKQVLQEDAVGEVKFESVFEIRDKVSTGPKTTFPRVFDGPIAEEPKFDFGQEYERAPAKNVRPLPKYSRRAQLAEYIVAKDNHRFRRNIANRIWASVMGRGIVHPVDYDHSENTPSHPELLDLLAESIASRQYDMRALLREILVSKTYQRSSMRTEEQRGMDPPEDATFAVGLLRPMMAEQFAWSIMQATGVTDNYRANLGKNLSEEKLHQQLAGIEQHFVNLFGGEPGKVPKDFEATIEQTLYLSNDGTIQGWLNPAGVNLSQRLNTLPPQDSKAIAEELYLSCLTRLPTETEIQEVQGYLADRSDSRVMALQELIWALVTSAEFRFIH